MYTYNGEGLRIRKTVDDVALNFRYEGDKVAAEYDGNFSLTSQNVFAIHTAKVVCKLCYIKSNSSQYRCGWREISVLVYGNVKLKRVFNV